MGVNLGNNGWNFWTERQLRGLEL